MSDLRLKYLGSLLKKFAPIRCKRGQSNTSPPDIVDSPSNSEWINRSRHSATDITSIWLNVDTVASLGYLAIFCWMPTIRTREVRTVRSAIVAIGEQLA